MFRGAQDHFLDQELAHSFAQIVIGLFEAEASVDRIYEIARTAFEWGDFFIEAVEANTSLPRQLACQPGCSCCCHNQVELTPPEAILLGGHLAQRCSPAYLSNLLELAAQSLDRRVGMTKIQVAARRRELPCPLLLDDNCSVYEVRPLMCRAMHSLDAAACRQELTDPKVNRVEFYRHRHSIFLSLSRGLIDGCRTLGYQTGPLDLSQALQDYFSQPDLAEAWLLGGQVFRTGPTRE
ncbi:MAG TPA: hypothetical protein DCY27_05340 [Desulfobacterales bacterium]|nr:hypothetical protein [Desulfobacterales bacterium]